MSHDTPPSDEDLEYARRLISRRVTGDERLSNEMAAQAMSHHLLRVDGRDADADAEQIRQARAFGYVFMEDQKW